MQLTAEMAVGVTTPVALTPEEDVTSIAHEVIEGVIGAYSSYDTADAGDWSDRIGANTVEALTAHFERGKERRYRFTVTVTLVQHGEGISACSAAAWNPETDFVVRVSWQNQAITCLVVVFALAW